MNLFVQEAAERHLLRQVEWYAEQGLPDIAMPLLATPEAGPPKHTSNPRLPGCGLGMSKASTSSASTTWRVPS